MGKLDALIERVSPRWAASRAYYRSMLGMARAYDAAKVGRRTDGWLVSNGSANAEIGAGGARIRARARDLVRNNPWASQAVRKLATKTVGTGIVPRPTVAGESVRSAMMDSWQRFVDRSDPEGQQDFYGQLSLAARTLFEGGEVLLRYIPRPASWGLPVPLQVAVLEPDFIDSSVQRALPDGGAIIQGVEYDAYGRRAAYWLFDQHPGDNMPFTRRNLASQRIDARFVAHCFDPQRPGQARGVPLFTPVVLKLRDIDDYDEAELVRRKIAACFAAFVKKGAGPTAGTLAGKATSTDAAGRRIEEITPGTVQYLESGDDITFAEPPAVDGYLEVMRHQLRAVAAGLGMPYELLTGDLSQVNYSSYRGGLVDFHDLLDHLQWLVIIPQLCVPTFRKVGQLAGIRGQDVSGWTASWTPPRRRWVDPVKEVAAARDAIRSGLTTLPEAIAEQGYDPVERLREVAATNKLLDELGLVFDSDGRRKSGGGATPAELPEAPARSAAVVEAALAGLISAQNRLVDAQNRLADAIAEPRELVFNDDGDPVGTLPRRSA